MNRRSWARDGVVKGVQSRDSKGSLNPQSGASVVTTCNHVSVIESRNFLCIRTWSPLKFKLYWRSSCEPQGFEFPSTWRKNGQHELLFVSRDSLGLFMSLMMVTQDTRDLVLLRIPLDSKRQVADGMVFLVKFFIWGNLSHGKTSA